MDQSIRDLENQHNEYKKTVEKNDGKSYFDKILEREKENPGIHEREYKAAVAMGQANADNFMGKALNHNHPDHGDALTAYRDKYGSSREAVEKDHTAKAIKLMDARRFEVPNAAYENNVLSAFQIRTPEDQAFLDKFKDYMKTKWKAVGYTGDADYFKKFWDVHPMSTPPKKTLGEDGKIYPYVIQK